MKYKYCVKGYVDISYHTSIYIHQNDKFDYSDYIYFKDILEKVFLNKNINYNDYIELYISTNMNIEDFGCQIFNFGEYEVDKVIIR